MKKPRVKDFDPNAVDTEAPKLGSPMDHMPPIGRPQHPGKHEEAEDRGERLRSTPVPPYARTGKPRRGLKRHPFDIYEDQLVTLKRFALDETINGGLGSMSRMVREAIDEWIAKRGKGA